MVAGRRGRSCRPGRCSRGRAGPRRGPPGRTAGPTSGSSACSGGRIFSATWRSSRRVERAEDRPHAADADRLLELERIDPLARHRAARPVGRPPSAPSGAPVDPLRTVGGSRRSALSRPGRESGSLPRARGVGSLGRWERLGFLHQPVLSGRGVNSRCGTSIAARRRRGRRDKKGACNRVDPPNYRRSGARAQSDPPPSRSLAAQSASAVA